MSSDDDDNKPLSSHHGVRQTTTKIEEKPVEQKVGNSSGVKQTSPKLSIQEPVDNSRLDQLLLEKANLHAYLKVYERLD